MKTKIRVEKKILANASIMEKKIRIEGRTNHTLVLYQKREDGHLFKIKISTLIGNNLNMTQIV